MTPTKTIRIHLKEIWPKLRFIMMTDPAFHLWDLSELMEFVQKSKAGQEQHVKNRRACEEFALEFLVESRKVDPGDGVNAACGFVFATSTKLTYQMPDPRHYLNIVDTNKGIYLIDIGSKEIWRPTNEDKVIFLLM